MRGSFDRRVTTAGKHSMLLAAHKVLRTASLHTHLRFVTGPFLSLQRDLLDCRQGGRTGVQDLLQTPPGASVHLSHHIAMQESLASSIFELRASNTKLQTQLNVLQLQLAASRDRVSASQILPGLANVNIGYGARLSCHLEVGWL